MNKTEVNLLLFLLEKDKTYFMAFDKIWTIDFEATI